MPTQQRKTKTQTTNNEAVKRVIHPDLRHQIEKRAYEIWLSSGCSQGNDVAHGFKQKMKCWRTVKGAQMRLSEPT